MNRPSLDSQSVTSTTPVIDRRSFLKLATLAGGGFALALYLRGPSALLAASPATAATGAADDFTPSLFIRISSAGTITILASNPEIGQGVKTSLPMIIAEELDVAWEQVSVVQADYDERLGRQAAGGSQAVRTHYEPFRQLGATARALLVSAAAARWKVPVAQLTTPGDARVVHAASSRSATYGELATAAAALPLPDPASVTLKKSADFHVMGRRIGGVDNIKIVRGAPLFGIDVRQPGQVFATFVKCPVFDGVVKSASLDAARKAPGVLAVFTLNDQRAGSGVAIVARSTFEAFKARDLLAITWDEGDTAQDSTAGFVAGAEAAWKNPVGPFLVEDGDFNACVAAPGIIRAKARYRYPLLSHVTLEPQNCTVLFKDGRAEVWAPCQTPENGTKEVARILGISTDAVTFHITRSGGGFGRRLKNDYTAEAAAIAKQYPNKPVQLVWTRADDMQHDHYRPAGFHSFEGGVDASGQLVAWSDHFITMGDGHTGTKISQTASLNPQDFPSRLVPNFRVRQTGLPNGIPLGAWRAPRSNAHCFAQQSFVDELAYAAKQDPVKFRLALLEASRAAPKTGAKGKKPGFDTARMAGVVRLAAEKSGWNKSLPRGRGRGIAFQYSHNGYAAIVVEVTVTPKGELTVDRVIAAVDVGSQIVNLSGAENQVEGSVVDGISSSLLHAITIANGRVEQSGFGDVQLLRINQSPRVIETHFKITDNPPTGLGEPVFPPVPPALCNAIFAATGKRIRELPIRLHDLSWS